MGPITTSTTTIPYNTPIPIQPKNECDPLTIFPLGAECFSIEPTYSDSFDGVVGLGITGGTPPYTILWNNGSVAPAIFNVGVGEYKATVTDYYKDFTATTTCVLTAITTTTTTLPPTTTQKMYNDFCVIVSVRDGDQFEEKLYDLTYNGFYNGYPSWTSVTDNLFVYWSANTTNLWILNGFPNISVTNNVYNEPSTGEPLPFNNWQVLGTFSPKIQIDVRVVPGPCSSVNEPTISLIKNDPTCGCNGSISIQVNGGTPPYQYSIDGGLSYQTNPVFQNLCFGGYTTFVKDSNDFVDSQFVTLTQTTLVPITLSLQYTGPNSFQITTSPTPPPGVVINFTLTHNNSFTKQPATSTQTYSNVVTLIKNTIVVPSSVGPVISTTNLPVVGPCSVLGKLKTDTNTTWQNISTQAGDVITGTFTDVVSTLIPIPGCYVEPITSKNLYISLEGIDSCLQQYITVVNPPLYVSAYVPPFLIP
jgi:hypothetical protein